jgi:threonine/homoserine/homoserine lactone efflux protein
MTVEQSLVAYFAAAAILTITPGVDTALILRTTTAEGTKQAIGAGLGVALGLLTWGCIVAVGLGELLAASQFAYTALRWIGATYLLYLGAKMLLKPRSAITAPESAAPTKNKAVAPWFARGLLNNLLNPKIGVFYVSFLPQFVPLGVSVGPWTFMLAAIHAGQVLLWFALLIGASVPLRRFLSRPKVVRSLDRVTGAVFIAFGAKLALSKT